MKNKLILFTLLSIVLVGCSKTDLKYLQKDYFIEEKGVVVASCPSRISLKVNDFSCVTPCRLELPDDTDMLKLEYKDQVGYVQVSRSGFHGSNLQGSLLILNANLIGVNSDSPQAPYFLRDSELGLTDFCGVQGTLY